MATGTRLGTTIKRARERKRLSQQELADKLGVSRSAVNSWENGRAHPRSSIGAIEDILGVSLTGDLPPSLDPEVLRLAERLRSHLDDLPAAERDIATRVVTDALGVPASDAGASRAG